MLKTTLVSIVLILGSALLWAQEDDFRTKPQDRFLSTERGNQQIRLTQRELAMIPFLYREKGLNDWYSRFWEHTDIQVPEQARIIVMEDPGHPDAILLMCVLTNDAHKHDQNLTKHRNIARMLRDEFAQKNKLPDGIHLFVAVDFWPYDDITDYRLRYGLQYVEPFIAKDPELQLPESTGFGRNRTSVTGIEFVLKMMEPAMEEFERSYSEILQMNGLRYHLDGRVSLVSHDRNLNAVAFLFEINNRVARTDRNLRLHSNIGERFGDMLIEKMPIIPDWLETGVAVDSTGGYFAPVILK